MSDQSWTMYSDAERRGIDAPMRGASYMSLTLS